MRVRRFRVVSFCDDDRVISYSTLDKAQNRIFELANIYGFDTKNYKYYIDTPEDYNIYAPEVKFWYAPEVKCWHNYVFYIDDSEVGYAFTIVEYKEK